jgi:putative transposase
MKKSRYSESQIMNILKQAEAGIPVPELCREHGMSSASFYKWRSKYGGLPNHVQNQILISPMHHSPVGNFHLHSYYL